MRHQDNTGKFIAFILRHHPESIGMKLDGHGWARTEDLIAGIAKSRPFDMQMLEEIVRTDSTYFSPVPCHKTSGGVFCSNSTST